MGLVEFTYRDLHAEAPLLRDDLDAIYSIVAGEFQLLVGGKPLYRESEFPLVELAQALDAWLRDGLAQRRAFSFSPTGYAEPGALRLQPRSGNWMIDSSRREAGSTPQEIQTGHLKRAFGRFLGEVSADCATLGVDLEGLLQRMRRYSVEHGERGGND